MKKALTTEQFIEKARKIHGDKYDYSKVVYVNNRTKVCIICPIHGEFWQTPCDHLNRRGCFKCSKNQKYTTEEYIKKAHKIHNYKYGYEKTNYVNSHTKIIVTCPIHGDFEILATNHLCGDGCTLCSKSPRYDTNKWKIKAKEKHNDKYDYSKVKYINNRTKVCIICHNKDKNGNEHGEFWQLPSSHLQGCGCPKCADKYTLTKNEFIDEAIKVHGHKYDYSKMDYVNHSVKICIICPKHGEFWQTPRDHLHGRGCPQCAGHVLKTKKQFIKEANQIHRNFFIYDKVEYVNTNTKIIITCPIHGDFTQLPSAHLRGAGCPVCCSEHKNLAETKLKRYFEEIGINFEYQKRFKWLGLQSLDFYFPEYNAAIEYQGRQHFCEESYYFEYQRDEILKRDLRKIQLCNENGISIYHLTNEINYIPEDFEYYKLYTKIDDILKEMCHD